MTSFYCKVENLCKNKGITIANLLKDLNMSSSSGTNWKNGKIPKSDTVRRIAVYFSVPTDFLLSEKVEDKFYPLSESALSLLEVFYALDETTQQRLIGRIEMLAFENYNEYFRLIKIIKDSGITEEKLIDLITHDS